MAAAVWAGAVEHFVGAVLAECAVKGADHRF